jgi:cell division protein FtsX
MGFLIAAVVLGIIGYLLRFRHWGWLVSGYNTSSKEAKERYDVVALTRGVGNFTFLLAAMQVVAGIGLLAGVEWVPVAAMVSLLVASLAFIVYANTGHRYMRKL